MNVEDNILVAPGTINLLDAVSIHTYRSYNAANVAQFASYGKPIWDTESWIGVGAVQPGAAGGLRVSAGFCQGAADIHELRLDGIQATET